MRMDLPSSRMLALRLLGVLGTGVLVLRSKSAKGLKADSMSEVVEMIGGQTVLSVSAVQTPTSSG